MSMIIEMIRMEFGICTKAHMLRRLLRRTGFSCRKSRYIPYRLAPGKQDESKKMAGKCTAQMR